MISASMWRSPCSAFTADDEKVGARLAELKRVTKQMVRFFDLARPDSRGLLHTVFLCRSAVQRNARFIFARCMLP